MKSYRKKRKTEDLLVLEDFQKKLELLHFRFARRLHLSSMRRTVALALLLFARKSLTVKFETLALKREMLLIRRSDLSSEGCELRVCVAIARSASRSLAPALLLSITISPMVVDGMSVSPMLSKRRTIPEII